jgi:hypothetical protein
VGGDATPTTGQNSPALPRPVAQPPRPKPVQRVAPQAAASPERSATTARSPGQGRPAATLPRLAAERSGSHGSETERTPAHAPGASWVQEYRDLEGAIRLRNYSSKTLEAYRLWVVKFQAFVRSRPTIQLYAGVERFSTPHRGLHPRLFRFGRFAAWNSGAVPQDAPHGKRHPR